MIFNDKLWLVGGETSGASGSEALDDVWWTSDCVNWNQAASSAEFWARGYHSMAVFGGKMWLLGGLTYDQDGTPVLLSDTWTSSNGINWTEIQSLVSFFPRMKGSAAAIGSNLWLFTGLGENALGEIGPLSDGWYTSDGSTWVRAFEKSGFTPRSGAVGLTSSGSFWLIGGLGQDSSGWDTYLNDVWATGDGLHWNNILDIAPESPTHFGARASHGGAVHGSRMFLSGGETDFGPINDVWSAQ